MVIELAWVKAQLRCQIAACKTSEQLATLKKNADAFFALVNKACFATLSDADSAKLDRVCKALGV